MRIWDDDNRLMIAVKEMACYLVCMGAMYLLFNSMEILPGAQGETGMLVSDIVCQYGLGDFVTTEGLWGQLCQVPLSNSAYMWLSLYPLVVLLTSVLCYFLEIGMISKALREYSLKFLFIVLMLCVNGLVDLLMFPAFIIGNLFAGLYQLLFRRR